ncbi:hypothetical protein AYI68_g218 [Smittium mucronatum]|uniref:Uncharacterized protein n=1 Tax=Smittium mucronatum TaxID=133383 RepID=A0A1R0H8V4_9FUNG|nr:hypothetical protein AYI68_g218 [Smittium mucronatum]
MRQEPVSEKDDFSPYEDSLKSHSKGVEKIPEGGNLSGNIKESKKPEIKHVKISGENVTLNSSEINSKNLSVYNINPNEVPEYMNTKFDYSNVLNENEGMDQKNTSLSSERNFNDTTPKTSNFDEDKLAFSIMDIIEPAILIINDRLERVQLSQSELETSLDQVNEQLNLYCEWISPDEVTRPDSLNIFNYSNNLMTSTANMSISGSIGSQAELSNVPSSSNIKERLDSETKTSSVSADAIRDFSRPNLSNFVLSGYPEASSSNVSMENMYEHTKDSVNNSPQLLPTPFFNQTASHYANVEYPRNITSTDEFLPQTPVPDSDIVSIKSIGDLKSPLNLIFGSKQNSNTSKNTRHLYPSAYQSSRAEYNHVSYNEHSVSDPYLPRKPSSTTSNISAMTSTPTSNNYRTGEKFSASQQLIGLKNNRKSTIGSNISAFGPNIDYDRSDPDITRDVGSSRQYIKEHPFGGNSQHMLKVEQVSSQLDSTRKRLASVNNTLKLIQKRLQRISTLAQTKIAQKRLLI